MPTRSASFSLARVKLICCCMAAPCAMEMPPSAASLDPVAAPSRMDGEDGRHGRDALPALRAHAPRDVALGDVRDFVREHAGELRFVARGQHQSVVHADETAGQRERVDGVVAHEEELEALRGIAGGLGHDARAERLQVFGGFRVVDDLALVAQLPHDLQADAVLVVERQRRGGRAADVGQIIAGASGPAPGAAGRASPPARRADFLGQVFDEDRHLGLDHRACSRSSRSVRAYQRRNRPAVSVRRGPA